MIEFIKRGGEPHQVCNHPLWLSGLMLSRGIDTPEKADAFLHPSLEHLHDPMLMQGMDKAVSIIRDAVQKQEPILVYGDYDVDGVSATCIMLETLRTMGAKADFRIPSRHSEGYGLNEKAVREIAERYKLLITVDCGVTNLEEVELAKLLGMRVIVTDHHQLAEQLPKADAVLNPLLGDYPFRRLCGAGVALKICQALLGMEGIQDKLEIAALATVADVVPLIDENRIIVREGMARMAVSARPGLKALITVSDVTFPVTSEQVAFRLAPRINAGGRLEDASIGVKLLMTRDQAEAEKLALHLHENNKQRQGIEREITVIAEDAVRREIDFRDDRAIIVMGEGWNSGVIGLTAGKLCEKWHFPTIVLSKQGELAVGSCRSIPGVNIYAMLTTCKDLFVRFGGHEQAAGLTMRAELVPELKRRLNLAIRENCDMNCYVPRMEYDLEMPLSYVTLDWIEQLSIMEPTGCGNPPPVFLAQGAQVQQMRRVGKDLTHLKLSLLSDGQVRDGIGFSLGDAADEGMEAVDVLYAPEKNEFRGKVTPQLQVKALRAAEGSIPCPEAEAFFPPLLQEMATLATNFNKVETAEKPITEAVAKKLLSGGMGTLIIAHEREKALSCALMGRVDIAARQGRDPRSFNTLLCAPDLTKLTDQWQHILLADGDLLPGEAALLRERCPRAELHFFRVNPLLKEQLTALALSDEELRTLYRACRAGNLTPRVLAEKCDMTEAQVLVGLTAFQQVGLAEVQLEPYEAHLILPPPKPKEGQSKLSMGDSPLMRYLRQMADT
jgi:single-stranded-DNA-specific exonuclease